MKEKIIILLYSGHVFLEISTAISLLSSKYELLFATPDGNDVYPEEGFCLRTNLKFSEMKTTLAEMSSVSNKTP